MATVMHSFLSLMLNPLAPYLADGRSRYRRPAPVPHGFEPVPLAFTGLDAVPLVGVVSRLWHMVNDPVGLAQDAAEQAGGAPFTLRIPGKFDLTYLGGVRGYKTLTSLPADEAAIGEILGNVPNLSLFGFPRSGASDDYDKLQQLAITGKRILARMLTPDRVAGLAPLIDSVMRERMQPWGDMVDFAQDLHPAIFEISIRYFGGDELFARYGDQLIPALRDIADAIDIPRAALAITPAKFVMREYRATRRLARILRRAQREIPHTPIFSAIAAANVAAADQLWIAMFLLWNSVTYPGAYACWTMVDLMSDSRTRAALAATDERQTLISWGLWETIRLNPIASLVRYLRKPLEYEYSGHRYLLPAGTVAGVSPWRLNRDPEVWDDPDQYRPERFSGVTRPQLFGAGPFACVAGEFSRALIAGVCDAILTANEVQFRGPLPRRRCRVHLTYPSGPVVATLRSRTSTTNTVAIGA
ncbi:cytochrome P450 [Nocardia tengchongensis]|uniref:cytochrome P450 n=1 Tax=Nocardia tengchongensis TaxID=2055889 RepID=UPI00369798C4